MIVNNTPVEERFCAGFRVLVKREDLCSPEPGPSFSKMRGVAAHIANRPEPVIGVLDTFHSKAGWAVSYACNVLGGKQAVNYWPRYKADPQTGIARPQQQHAYDLGAKLVAIKAGRSAILYHAARKHLRENYPDSYLMPNALKLPESITENAAEAFRTCEMGNVPQSGTLVLSVSSGTVAAGVIKGFKQAGFLDNYLVKLHMGYDRSEEAMRLYMERLADLDLSNKEQFEFINEKYGYADAAPEGKQIGFPCNPYYDAKAWRWLEKRSAETVNNHGPLVFWNIGS